MSNPKHQTQKSMKSKRSRKDRARRVINKSIVVYFTSKYAKEMIEVSRTKQQLESAKNAYKLLLDEFKRQHGL